MAMAAAAAWPVFSRTEFWSGTASGLDTGEPKSAKEPVQLDPDPSCQSPLPTGSMRTYWPPPNDLPATENPSFEVTTRSFPSFSVMATRVGAASCWAVAGAGALPA